MLAATSCNTSSSTAALTCATCLTTFKTKETKRIHMKNDWHVLNLQRRLASLPPVSVIEFDAKGVTSNEPVYLQDHVIRRQYYGGRKPKVRLVMTKSPYSKPPSDPDDHLSSSVLDEEEASSVEFFDSTRCLFCNAMSPSLDTNLTHMSLDHSFFIPNISELNDTESFLSYLFVIIAEFHECLLCGKEKTDIFAVQDHMRAKGHCRIDCESEEHQLWDFYDRGTYGQALEEDTNLIPVHDELRLPSGKVLGHRSAARISRQHHVPLHRSVSSLVSDRLSTEVGYATTASRSIPAAVRTNHTTALAIVRAGTSTSLVGVPELQQRALVAAEKKMETLATRTKNEYQSKLERGGNKQKRYRVLTMGKKAGGLEKRNG